jgi:hypothetical protein
MNFSPQVKAWLQLVSLVLGTGSGVAVTAYLGGARPMIAFLCGLGTAATNVYHALTDSPRDKAIGAGDRKQETGDTLKP